MKATWVGILGSLLLAAPSWAEEPVLGLPQLSLQLEGQTLRAEVAATPDSRRQGLMGRTELASDSGMLFVFIDDAIRCLWMKDTSIPLSAAFIDSDGYLLNLVDLQPQDEHVHCSLESARYALEVEQGWFARHGIQPGSRVQGLPNLERGN